MAPMPSVETLKRALEIAEKIQELEAELNSLLGGSSDVPKTRPVTDSASPSKLPRKKRGMSAAGRARVAAAQRARWAKLKKGEAKAVASPKTRKKKRTMSPEARAKIAAAQRARWAKQKSA
jgi:hypothetical protein